MPDFRASPTPAHPPSRPAPLPHGWQWVRVGKVAELNPRRRAGLNRPDDAPTTFVPMPAVDEVRGMIATAHFTGAVGQQRVLDYFLKELKIPLPPLAEQRRIAWIVMDQLAAVERARQAAEDELNVTNSLRAVILRRAFSGGI